MTHNNCAVPLADIYLVSSYFAAFGTFLAGYLWQLGLKTSAKSNVQAISSNCGALSLHKHLEKELAECESSEMAPSYRVV